MKIAVAAVAIAAAVGLAPNAHADDQAFLNDLNQNRIGTGVTTDPLGMGHFMCTQIRGGMTPEQASHMSWGPGLDMPGIVSTAQRDLCPDTLH
jgi:hypothetical protein